MKQTPPNGVIRYSHLKPGVIASLNKGRKYNEPLKNKMPKQKRIPDQRNNLPAKSLYKIPTVNNANT